MRPSLYHRTLFALLASHIAWASYAHAFQQGSYYVIDLVESEEAESLAGRLAVPATALADSKATTPITTIQERSEFEIDYANSIGTSSDSGFELDKAPETTFEVEDTSFSTSTFDFGSSNTVFGD